MVNQRKICITNFLIIQFLVFTLYACTPDTVQQQSNNASFQIIPEAIDLGVVQSPELLDTKVRLLNNSSKPLTISSVTATCSCVKLSLSNMVIQPKSSVDGTVRLELAKKEAGPFYFGLNIQTDQSSTPQSPISIKGIAELKYFPTLIPQQIDFGAIPFNTTNQKSVEVFTPTNSGYQFLKIEEIIGPFEVTTEKISDSKTKLDVSIDFDYPPGPIRGQIRVDLTKETLTIPITGEKLANFQINPSKLILSKDGQAKEITLNFLEPPHINLIQILNPS